VQAARRGDPHPPPAWRGVPERGHVDRSRDTEMPLNGPRRAPRNRLTHGLIGLGAYRLVAVRLLRPAPLYDQQRATRLWCLAQHRQDHHQPNAYNDGAWHLADATLFPAGMALYLDGQQVAADPHRHHVAELRRLLAHRHRIAASGTARAPPGSRTANVWCGSPTVATLPPAPGLPTSYSSYPGPAYMDLVGAWPRCWAPAGSRLPEWECLPSRCLD
jgi:hypothetical protein